MRSPERVSAACRVMHRAPGAAAPHARARRPAPRSRTAHCAAAPASTVNCFDYYSFGSVQVDVTASVQSAVSGTPVSFVGKLKNANPYPVVGGSVYVKIFKDRGDGSKGRQRPRCRGPVLRPRENISIPANGEKPIEITWNVPSYAVSGSYKLATFFTVAKKFNLLGLPFTDDVVGNTAPFRVMGEQKASVAFKKDTVTVRWEPVLLRRLPAARRCREARHRRSDSHQYWHGERHHPPHLDALPLGPERPGELSRQARGRGHHSPGR